MKKYLISFCSVIFATCLFLGCNDEFLERYPLDQISSKTFWNTENDLIVYNNSLYNLAMDYKVGIFLMGHGTGYDFITSPWNLDEFTDNIAPINARHDYFAKVRAGKHTVSFGNERFGWQNQGWIFVRAINVGLANYDNAQIPKSVRDKYSAEAHLFRGWFYAEKVSLFGDIPWIDKELNIDSEELFASRNSREEVMLKVLADINFACEKLPEDWGDGNAPGRLNKWAALQIKSRVCLFEGTWRKYHGGANANMWLQEAADAAKEIMENGPYRLYTTGDAFHDYNAIHRMTDLKGVSEVLYWRKYEQGIIFNCAMGYNVAYNGGATKSMVEDYLCIDGLPITLSSLYKGDEVYENIFENRDPRLRQTILFPEDQPYYNYGGHEYNLYPYPRLLGMVGGEASSATGYHIIKNYEPYTINYMWGKATTPAIVLRYGEVLLNYAEAKAELGTINQSDLDVSINILRNRVAMPHLDLNNIPVDPRYINDGVSPLIIEIRRERRIELFMEGFRYDDLRRWKQGKKLKNPDYGIRWDANYKARIDPQGLVKLKSSIIDGIEYIDVYKGTSWNNPVFDENKHYLWPIPLSAIAENTNLKQNPGW